MDSKIHQLYRDLLNRFQAAVNQVPETLVITDLQGTVKKLGHDLAGTSAYFQHHALGDACRALDSHLKIATEVTDETNALFLTVKHELSAVMASF